jgi:hypothetical protein
MRLLGEIVKLQTQVESLKVGVAPWRRYDPSALRQVAALSLSADGVQGWTEDGQPVPDVHNLTHPMSKNRGGANGISICFSSHYAAMRTRFGDHVVDGIAGENIFVALNDSTGLLQEEDLRGRVVIETADGQVTRLEQVIVAAPCVEFTRYAMRFPDDARPDRTVTEALQFLDGGLRGFYATYQGPPVKIALGDKVFLADPVEGPDWRPLW